MRCSFETIALLYHATGTGKTVTAVMDAKRFGKRTLFLAHTVELVDQAAKTFRELWPGVTVCRPAVLRVRPICAPITRCGWRRK